MAGTRCSGFKGCTGLIHNGDGTTSLCSNCLTRGHQRPTTADGRLKANETASAVREAMKKFKGFKGRGDNMGQVYDYLVSIGEINVG